ncbi:GTP-binding protein [Microdochium trichocladiopsis]|uniref:GTP-binding protein n=1 Tax=Microdochium trichocladiopsis TaxID=1682393 RepID=A0A9P8YAF0_9PEZI|nr:GTP-binding protein [Microdochium trichocladiopsis]KAH7034883.1 GTP-binding protein [Microdochium trichocladiopsis]
MASIFTFDTAPPRVNSPWEANLDSRTRPLPGRSLSAGPTVEADDGSDLDLDRLEAEPQDGPIEYKLHLLLRPRRSYKMMSTTTKTRSRSGRTSKLVKDPGLPLAASAQTRQNRLQHLTTQLLWRLQQSSPYHSTAKNDLVIPKAPDEEVDLETLEKPGRLLPGLEESNGALYEIGVADDGTLVGLTKDEMDESMRTLKIMAASLGCRVEVQRMKAVGTCQWADEALDVEEKVHEADLWVAEALVSPILNTQCAREDEAKHDRTPTARPGSSTAKQLRVALTGPTTSGKTSILGTLSNGCLDNGRGSSRMNLLKHQHEVASGRTSSVAQELIGYQGDKVYNYAMDNINAWPDIHDQTSTGRLVFFLDSAGHPRYQRTTLRALVGWAPDWTVLCIAANEGDSPFSSAHSLSASEGPSGHGMGYLDLAMAHLDLCLKLEIPLVILITKYDLAQRGPLRELMSMILSKIKLMQRTPKLLAPAAGASVDLSLDEIPSSDSARVQTEVIDKINETGDLLSIVPVLLTSAVKGTNIPLTHALLRALPIPPGPTARDFVPAALNPEQPQTLFHIDEVYELPLSRGQVANIDGRPERAPVVTGYLRFGKLTIGDEIVLGPFPAEEDEAGAFVPQDHPSPGYGLSLPHPSSAQYARLNSRHPRSASAIDGEWRTATVVNIRNLRMPVQSLEAGQAGSLQISVHDTSSNTSESEGMPDQARTPAVRLRKGQVIAVPSKHMVDTGLTLQAASGFTASFKSPDVKALTIGGMINIYVGMVRAAARILHVAKGKSMLDLHKPGADEGEDLFVMTDHVELERTRSEADLQDYQVEYHVSFELLTNKEWIELGSRVVINEGSSKDKSGLDGYVGQVIEISE